MKMKKYRVDTFKDSQHIIKYFDNEADAKESIKPNEINFLLKLIECTGKYDVICQL